ncbi:putative uncharacterized hydrolase [Smittium culicis]|uniref:Uncharacterized hydrolase n=1 Tax=Smittium culicis TaxID=133412 RepID=A0A1R1Y6J2_9FUNG|nr:putative uncharacterized hydrolase [Smittium culicis]
MDGTLTLPITFLESKKYNKAILTLNNITTVDHMLNVVAPNLPGGKLFNFDKILTRDFDYMKPDPEPLLHIANSWNLKPEEIIMVGDSADDVECGLNAGAITILLRNEVRLDYRFVGFA